MTAPTPERRVGEADAELQAALATIKAAQPCPNVTTTLTALRELAKQDSHYRGALYDTTTRAATVIEHQVDAVARLRAEVERLRGIAEYAVWMLNEWDESMSSYQQGTSDGATAKELAARLAGLSLPTPAPEATG